MSMTCIVPLSTDLIVYTSVSYWDRYFYCNEIRKRKLRTGVEKQNKSDSACTHQTHVTDCMIPREISPMALGSLQIWSDTTKQQCGADTLSAIQLIAAPTISGMVRVQELLRSLSLMSVEMNCFCDDKEAIIRSHRWKRSPGRTHHVTMQMSLARVCLQPAALLACQPVIPSIRDT